ncbi:MAG TPA: hypothetical protein VFZ48_04695 [Candidatus Saccharimonadales bacterium]
MSNVRRRMNTAIQDVNRLKTQLLKAEAEYATAVIAAALAGELDKDEAHETAIRIADCTDGFDTAAEAAGMREVTESLVRLLRLSPFSNSAGVRVYRSGDLLLKVDTVAAGSMIGRR